MKTHLMVKRNWLVSLCTRYNYFMACNSKRRFQSTWTFFDKFDNHVNGETSVKDIETYAYSEDRCKNCMSTNVYKEMICNDTK